MNNWSSEEFTITEIDENMKNKIFIVPKYQRGIVWNDDQRDALVDTIKRGLPFGSLLLYKTNDGNYQIIDGLQRITSLIDFRNNPTNFFTDNDIDDKVIDQIVELLGVNGPESAIANKISELLIEWVKNDHQTLDDVKHMQYAKFVRLVTKNFPTAIGKEFDISDLIQPMLENFQQVCEKIISTRVPAIIMTGDSDQLPILFERINSRGIQLTKYQVFAASWINEKFTLDDSNLSKFIVKANKDHYDSMLDGKSNLDDYDPVTYMQTRELNTFEIAFGFGKYLRHKWPHLFGPVTEDQQVDSVGFNLLNACLCCSSSELKNFSSNLMNKINNNINTFLDAVLSAVNTTNKKIGSYCKFKCNTQSNTKGKPLHTELQICSIVASVFICRFVIMEKDDNDSIINIDFDFTKNRKWKQGSYDSFEKNVAKIYFMDIFNKRWAGTGDKKLNSVIGDPAQYTREVSKQSFVASLDSYFNSVKEERKESTRVALPKEPERAILALTYLWEFAAIDQIDDSKYDIEHLVPKELLKKRLQEDYNGQLKLPISSVGNICLLPQAANRSKKDKTIYQDKQYLSKSDFSLEDIEQKFTFTKESDLKWIENQKLTQDQFEEAYMQFITQRYKTIRDKIMENFDNI